MFMDLWVGRSHAAAAAEHCRARWVFSVDIKDFFQSTPTELVALSLEKIGFTEQGSLLLSSLACLRGVLAQGAPTSPVLSNICFDSIDQKLLKVALQHNVRLTRYADDIVFSGTSEFPLILRDQVLEIFVEGPWRLAAQKTKLFELPDRLKVHGLLVHGESIRLTKGYRNKLRAYRHLLSIGGIRDSDRAKVIGHVIYGAFIDKLRFLEDERRVDVDLSSPIEGDSDPERKETKQTDPSGPIERTARPRAATIRLMFNRPERITT
jgi:RNA-directed DNA polymerase